MFSQIAPPNSYVLPLQILRTIFNLIRDWLDKSANLLQGIRGQTRWVQATILFTDIAGFSAAIAHLPRRQQEQVLESLTGEYYNLLHRCVRDRGGSVDKFIGDGMMAVFLNPDEAINAARRIQEDVARFNTQQERQGYCPFPTRTAIDSGWVICKNLGPFWCRDQTYLGNAVNTAAHLAQVGRPGQVLISHTTFKQVPAKAAFSRWEAIEGIEKGGEIIVYEL